MTATLDSTYGSDTGGLLAVITQMNKIVSAHRRHSAIGIEYEPTCDACVYYAAAVAKQSEDPVKVKDALQFLTDLFPTMGIKSEQCKKIIAKIDALLTMPSVRREMLGVSQ